MREPLCQTSSRIGKCACTKKYSFLNRSSLSSFNWIVLGEDGHAFVEDVILVILDERGAHAQTFLP